MKKLYEKWRDPKKTFNINQQTNLDDYSFYVHEIMMLIAYFNTKPNQLTFFDFGMGWGNWCQLAKAFGCDSYGNEISDPLIKYAKSQGIKVIHWDEISDYCFDFINTEQVFEHISKPLETLSYLKKSLKPEGLIKISVPNCVDIKRRLKILNWTAPKGSRNSLNPVSPLEHINCFNSNSIIRMADITGLELMKIPLKIQYAYNTNWKSKKRIIKNILRPLYRNMFGTFLFFRHK